MKLKNPTDDELNAAFALEVAGWRKEIEEGPDGEWWSSFVGPNGEEKIPPFTTSADAVLPWLEKCVAWERFGDGEVAVSMAPLQWRVSDLGMAFPRAAVIALLRAHGVTVEFSK